MRRKLDNLMEELSYYWYMVVDGVFFVAEVFWIYARIIVKIPFYALLLLAIGIDAGWRASRRQKWQVQLGIGIAAASILSIGPVAAVAGNSTNPVYISPLFVFVLGMLIVAIFLPSKSASQSCDTAA